MRRVLASVAPRRADLRADAIAAVPGAISSVPDGMASAVLVGVNPLYGLYASVFGPLVGGLVSSTGLMIITTTSAAALAAGSALVDVPVDQRPATLFLIVLLAGALMVAAGLLHLGRYTRFVSHSVMTGFLTAIAVNIICGQLADLSGSTAAQGSVPIRKALSVITHPGAINGASLVIGVMALAILLACARTRLSSISSLLALAVPTAAVIVLGLTTVAQVQDIGPIASGLPLPALPDLGQFNLSLLTSAAAIAVIVLVQGAGVSEVAPNPDRSRSNISRDFIAQGVANITNALFQGIPVGGSVGHTALNKSVGARSRWASILSGLWLGAILLVLAPLVGQVATPTLAAVLIYAAARSLRPNEVITIMRAGPIPLVAVSVTFVCTLLLPVATAVAVGVAISLIMQLNQEAMDLRVVRLVPNEAGQLVEEPAPSVLTDRSVTVLDIYGSLFYAGARTLQARLPHPGDASAAVVILRLRGRTTLGATFVHIITDYGGQLAARGGRLYLTGLTPELVDRITRATAGHLDGPITVSAATNILGQSTLAAFEDAQAWELEHRSDPPPDRAG